MAVFFDSMHQAKVILVNTLRTAFGERTGEMKYKYIANSYGGPNVKLPDSDPKDMPFTEIFISDTYPYKEKYLPAIVVSEGAMEDFQEAFNQEVGEKYENGVVVARKYAGAWQGNFTALLAAESTIEREEIADLISLYLIRIKREAAEKEGVFIKNVSYGAEVDEPYRNDLVYFLPVNVNVYTEWLHEIPTDTIAAVNMLRVGFSV